MESQLVDQLNKITSRLDQMQCQQDRLMERLDTTQNLVQSDNKKYNLLEEKLCEITSLIQQEKIFMKDHLKEAQDEILECLHDIQRRGEHLLPGNQPTLQQKTQSEQRLTDLIVELSDKMNIIDEKTNVIKTETSKTNKKCHDLETVFEDKLFHFVDLQRQQLTSTLDKIQSIPDIVRGQTRAELLWLNAETNRSLDNINTTFSATVEQLNKNITAQGDQSGQIIDLHIQLQKQITEMLGKDKKELLGVLSDVTQLLLNLEANIMQSISDMEKGIQRSVDITSDATVESIKELEEHMEMLQFNLIKEYQTLNKFITETVKMEAQTYIKSFHAKIESCTDTITNITNTTKDILEDHVTSTKTMQDEHLRNFKVETDMVKSIITSLIKKIDVNKVNLESLTTNIKNLKTSLSKEHTAINEQFILVKQQQDKVTKAVNISMNDLKDYICKTKREIFAVTEKETQIVRDTIEGPLPSHGNYTFHFYVENFQTLVRSGKDVFSPPWHINEMKSCVTGNVEFTTDGHMDVWLLRGRHPLNVGLKERPAITLEVKVTICDINNKVLETVNVGEKTLTINEAAINWNGEIGEEIGEMLCDDLICKGYGQKEGYWDGAILIRFEVTVL